MTRKHDDIRNFANLPRSAWITAAEARFLLGASDRTLYRLQRLEHFPEVHYMGSNRRFIYGDLLDWMATHRRGALTIHAKQFSLPE